jgi:hypothetical protein
MTTAPPFPWEPASEPIPGSPAPPTWQREQAELGEPRRLGVRAWFEPAELGKPDG